MSAALVKQSLSLFEDDLAKPHSDGKKKKSADPMKLIGTKKKGVRKELERLEKQHQKNKQLKLKKTVSSGVPNRCPEDVDYTEESVQALQRLERTKATDSRTATTILDHHEKNVARVRQKPKDKPTKTATKTVFTDSDFDKFMKEFDFK